MSRMMLGKMMMTFVLMAQSVLGFALDWSSNHLLNPAWHPHARFHGALLLFLLTGVSATGIWLLWLRSREPEVALKVAGFISLSFWTPFLYITALLPSATPWAGQANAVPHIAGHLFYPNIAVAVGFVLLTVLAWSLSRSERLPRLG